ncbi:MAG: NAD(P)H-hydrate epimerase [Candidatus Brocadiaceae bacterium]|nr:NAD(P)H-hydrate epimerase [Candidatus Brocadiaceae bacterium]
MIERPRMTREQVRAVDRIAMERYAMPGVILMENAGRACVLAAVRLMGGEAAGRRVGILCGRGNNGGDGLVVARHLSNAGARADVVLLTTVDEALEAGGDAAVNLRIVRHMALPLRQAPTAAEAAEAVGGLLDADLIVDAMLGTGARGEVREPVRSAIEALQGYEGPVLAVDVPSGLDCDTGRPMGACVRARCTVTFVARKVGFDEPGAGAWTGAVEVADIGVPRAVLDEVA